MGQLRGNWNRFPYRDTTEIGDDSIIVVGGIPFRFNSWDYGDGMWGHIFFDVAPNMLRRGNNNGAYHTLRTREHEIEGQKYTSELDNTHMATCCMSGINMHDGDALRDYSLSEILHCAAANIVVNLGYEHPELSKCIMGHTTNLVERWWNYDNWKSSMQNVKQTISKDGYVYFVQAENGGPIKIGWSTSPLNRMSSLQTSHPHKLKLLHFMQADRNVEKKLHAEFSKHRLEGEWFHPHQAILDAIKYLRIVGIKV